MSDPRCYILGTILKFRTLKNHPIEIEARNFETHPTIANCPFSDHWWILATIAIFYLAGMKICSLSLF